MKNSPSGCNVHLKITNGDRSWGIIREDYRLNKYKLDIPFKLVASIIIYSNDAANLIIIQERLDKGPDKASYLNNFTNNLKKEYI